MPLFCDSEVVRVDLKSEPGEWVDLKKELTAGDNDAAWEAAGSAVLSRLGDTNSTVALNRERLRLSIVAWSAPLELSPKNIEQLREEVRDELVDKVNELNPFVLPRIPILRVAASLPTSAATVQKRPKA